MASHTTLLRNMRTASTGVVPASKGCSRIFSRCQRLRVLSKVGDQPGAQAETSRPEQGSFGKIEAPVRDTKPDAAAANVEDRDPDSKLTSPELNRDTEWFGTEVGFLDGMRFYGAIPEVNNCRLAMLGFFAAIIAGTTAPVVRGFPRRGNSIFSPDAEVINGRLAMVAFFSIVVITAVRGSYLDIWPFF